MNKTITMSLEDARKLYASSNPEWKKILEDNFGKKQLTLLTYEKIATELFYNKLSFYTDEEGDINSVNLLYLKDVTHLNNCITKKQAEHLLAHNQLINVASYLNEHNKICSKSFYYIVLNKSTKEYLTLSIVKDCSYIYGMVLFNTEKLAKQAIEILGEEIILKALNYE